MLRIVILQNQLCARFCAHRMILPHQESTIYNYINYITKCTKYIMYHIHIDTFIRLTKIARDHVNQIKLMISNDLINIS